jgi:hypothetical protein
MSWKEFFNELNISAPALMAGMAGGSIMMLKYKEISWRRAISLILASSVGSGYLTELTVHGIGLQEGMIGAIGFCIGLVFILVLDVIVSIFKFISANPKMVIDFLTSFILFKKNKTENEKTIIDEDDSVTELDGGIESDQQGQP